MAESLVEQQAVKIAARVDSAKVQVASATIIAILISVLPQVLKSWSDKEEPDPVQVNASIKRQHEKNPKRLQRRTAIAVRRKSPRESKPSEADANEIARAMIAEACEADADTVAALCRACVEDPGELGCP